MITEIVVEWFILDVHRLLAKDGDVEKSEIGTEEGEIFLLWQYQLNHFHYFAMITCNCQCRQTVISTTGAMGWSMNPLPLGLTAGLCLRICRLKTNQAL